MDNDDLELLNDLENDFEQKAAESGAENEAEGGDPEEVRLFGGT
jgi:hypothetical protein